MSQPNNQIDRGANFVNGLQLWLQGDTKEAEQTFRRAINSEPTSLPAYNWMATLLVRQRRFSEARQFTSLGIALAARLRKKIGEGNQSVDIKTVGRALKRLHAVACAHLGFMDRSIAELTLLHHRDRDLDAAVELAGLLAESGRLQEAEDLYLELAKRSQPAVASNIYATLGLLKEQLGENTAALEFFALAWRSAPGDPITCLRYSRVLVEAGQPLKSADVLKEGVRLNPRDTGLLTTLGYILATGTHNWTESSRWLKRASRVSKKEPDALCMIGHTRACMYDYRGALECFLNAARAQDSETFNEAFSERDLRAFRRWAREHENDLGHVARAGRFAAVLATICDTFDFGELPFGPGYIAMEILNTVPGSAAVLSSLIAAEHRLKDHRRERVLFTPVDERTVRRAKAA